MAKPNIAIVGGGIAGVILSWQAHHMGFSVDLFDEEILETPSKVAAGILNPLSISRKKPIWNAKRFTQENTLFYSQFGPEVYHKVSMQVNVNSAIEQNNWATSRAGEEQYLEWKHGNTSFGIKGSAWVSTEKLLTLLPSSKFRLNKEKVNHKELEEDYDFIILATGQIQRQELESNGFRADMFRVVLGDILQVELQKPSPFMHLEGLFIIPLTNGKYVLGSTYIHQFKSVSKDPMRATELIEKARRQGIVVSQKISHRVAVRPAIYDRMPIVGKLEKNIYCFAGMGSRGLFHAPLLAKQLLNNLENEELIWKEVDIARAKITTP